VARDWLQVGRLPHYQWKSHWTITIRGKTRCVLLHFDSSKRCVCPLYKFLYAFKIVKLFLKHPVCGDECDTLVESHWHRKFKHPDRNLSFVHRKMFYGPGWDWARTSTLDDGRQTAWPMAQSLNSLRLLKWKFSSTLFSEIILFF